MSTPGRCKCAVCETYIKIGDIKETLASFRGKYPEHILGDVENRIVIDYMKRSHDDGIERPKLYRSFQQIENDARTEEIWPRTKY